MIRLDSATVFLPTQQSTEFPGDATGWFSVYTLFPLLRPDPLGGLRRRQSTAPPRSPEASLTGLSSARLFSTRQQSPLRPEITDP